MAAPHDFQTLDASQLLHAIAKELRKARQVCQAGTDKRHQPALGAVDFDASLVTRSKALLDSLRNGVTKFKKAQAEAKRQRHDDRKFQDHLLEAIEPIQTAARRYFDADSEVLRKDYFVGEDLSAQPLAQLVTSAETILARLVPSEGSGHALDVLPGIKAGGRISELAGAIGKVRSRSGGNAGNAGDEEALLATLRRDIAALAGFRRQIQLAVEQAYPWRAGKSATARKAFGLPKDKPLEA